MKTTKKTYILGNWKMYKKYNDIQTFFSTFNSLMKKDKTMKTMNDVIYGFAPTYIGLIPALSLKKNINTNILAQDINPLIEGAYTSQVSVEQVMELNIKYVIIGHSETRKYQGVTDEDINSKAEALLLRDMIPVICIGESLEEYKAQKTAEVLKTQINKAFKSISLEQAQKCLIAYEPIWAIGTGMSATREVIDQSIISIRKTLEKLYHRDVANSMPILYGGSVNAQKSKDLLSITNVNGLLIGGASLNPKEFYDILTTTPSYLAKKASQGK